MELGPEVRKQQIGCPRNLFPVFALIRRLPN